MYIKNKIFQGILALSRRIPFSFEKYERIKDMLLISTHIYLFMDYYSLLFSIICLKILIDDNSGGISMEKKILKRIEALRKRLNKLGLTHNLIDDEVVEVSQQLDRLLNEYQRINTYHQLSFW
jgi:hypothetical protein